VDKRKLQRSMYERTGDSLPQRLAMGTSGGAILVFAWWLLAGGGVGVLASRFHHSVPAGDHTRRIALAVALTIYYVRLLFTEFVFLRRGVGWNEVFSVAPWILTIVVVLGFAAGTDPAPLGIAAIFAIALFLFGSWMNTWAEFTRHRWKQRPENRGRLYTGGLFRISRHPNYLGDLISFSGLCVLSGRWFTAVIPVIMLAGFVFANIPILDAHLRDHYGAAFDAYAARTRKLIPLIY
jgi:protein-S-isoprenylcysteine O-methyltransferase Ste14